jgi:hypothetical protein
MMKLKRKSRKRSYLLLKLIDQNQQQSKKKNYLSGFVLGDRVFYWAVFKLTVTFSVNFTKLFRKVKLRQCLWLICAVNYDNVVFDDEINAIVN